MGLARDIIANSNMTLAQIVSVGVCIFLSALDGFYALSVSYAVSGIAEQWCVDKATLGILLAIELGGMSLGSVVLGPLADRLGPRPLILLCLIFMTALILRLGMSHQMILTVEWIAYKRVCVNEGEVPPH